MTPISSSTSAACAPRVRPRMTRRPRSLPDKEVSCSADGGEVHILAEERRPIGTKRVRSAKRSLLVQRPPVHAVGMQRRRPSRAKGGSRRAGRGPQAAQCRRRKEARRLPLTLPPPNSMMAVPSLTGRRTKAAAGRHGRNQWRSGWHPAHKPKAMTLATTLVDVQRGAPCAGSSRLCRLGAHVAVEHLSLQISIIFVAINLLI